MSDVSLDAVPPRYTTTRRRAPASGSTTDVRRRRTAPPTSYGYASRPACHGMCEKGHSKCVKKHKFVQSFDDVRYVLICVFLTYRLHNKSLLLYNTNYIHI